MGVASSSVTVLFATHSAYLDHLAGPRHPERPERLDAVLEGVRLAGLSDAISALEPRPAERVDLERVHPAWYLDRMETMCAGGGGRLDPDTYASPGSFHAARLAAGAGLTAVEALRAGGADAAFCAVRPPGHHASATESMGFCMISNVAVVAASLADEGERVMVLDYDAHHGNGTQAVFWDDPRVLFVSYHQWPLYPGTGNVDETGAGAGLGATLNIPLPAGATGDVYLKAFDEIVAPVAERFAPTWVIVSAGFDAHRDDPLTDMGLAAGDYGPLTRRVLSLVPAGRRLVMLEGGYDLDALTTCSTEVMRELAGVPAPAGHRAGQAAGDVEGPTAAGPGADAVAAVARHWQQQGWL
jgi:acetoin utilization deacetylase AcuC-like enzyme